MKCTSVLFCYSATEKGVCLGMHRHGVAAVIATHEETTKNSMRLFLT